MIIHGLYFCLKLISRIHDKTMILAIFFLYEIHKPDASLHVMNLKIHIPYSNVIHGLFHTNVY
uniref:Uncharacterized protein n=1 Tax=Arundo donax TaxID=35708 RepID=A0A0A9E6E7_ARUDO